MKTAHVGKLLVAERRLERQEGAGARQWRDERREWEGRVLREQVPPDPGRCWGIAQPML